MLMMIIIIYILIVFLAKYLVSAWIIASIGYSAIQKLLWKQPQAPKRKTEGLAVAFVLSNQNDVKQLKENARNQTILKAAQSLLKI